MTGGRREEQSQRGEEEALQFGLVFVASARPGVGGRPSRWLSDPGGGGQRGTWQDSRAGARGAPRGYVIRMGFCRTSRMSVRIRCSGNVT